LANNTISAFDSLTDIYYQEVERPHEKASGFNHSPASHSVSLLNKSYIKTLNGNADNNRGERGTLVIFDEAGFMEEKAILAVEPYTTTDTGFKTSTDENFDIRVLSKKPENQRLYISSASDETSYFFDKYKDFAKKMFAGDKRFFVADINADIPLAPTLKGKPYHPLVSKSEIDAVMSTNPTKAMREYYNKFDKDGGEEQIIKSHIIERNTTFTLPEIMPDGKSKYMLALDPALVSDNSVLGVMKLLYDDKRGWYGRLVNMDNFKDLEDKSGNKQLKYEDQVERLREYMVRYNGNNPEYQNIHKVIFDGGMAGAGLHYASTMRFDFIDSRGEGHRGIVDKDYFSESLRDFPNAYPNLRVVEPTKWKVIMVNRLIDLMNLGLIEFPEEYNGSGYVDIESDESEDGLKRVRLSKEEELALTNIDICKEETKMIHRYKTANGKERFDTRVDMARKVHDDRFFVLCLLANELYELRESDTLSKHKGEKKKDKRYLKLIG
jgi:hypothetical protein